LHSLAMELLGMRARKCRHTSISGRGCRHFTYFVRTHSIPSAFSHAGQVGEVYDKIRLVLNLH